MGKFGIPCSPYDAYQTHTSQSLTSQNFSKVVVPTVQQAIMRIEDKQRRMIDKKKKADEKQKKMDDKQKKKPDWHI